MDLEFFTRFPRLNKDLAYQIKQMPPYSSADCEIVVDGAIRSNVITALKDSSIPIKVIAFATPFVQGADERESPLAYARHVAESWGFEFAPFVDAHVYFGDTGFRKKPYVFKDDDAVENARMRMVTDARNQKIEGWMLKSGGQCGKWFKVKPSPTVDCVVTGWIPAEPGKYEGQIGSLVVSVYKGKELVEIASCSGMTDALRLEMTGDADTLVGRVAEIEYQIVGAGGRLTHPRFNRWRQDKPAHMCTIDQLTEGE